MFLCNAQRVKMHLTRELIVNSYLSAVTKAQSGHDSKSFVMATALINRRSISLKDPLGDVQDSWGMF